MTMRGASAESRAALSDRLDGMASGAGHSSTQLGEDLFGVAAVLRAQPAVRRMLTDPSTEAAAQSGLVRQLFDGKIESDSLDLVADAAERRWSSTWDLPAALEDLGVIAVVKSAGKDADKLADELFEVGQLIQHNADLGTALSDSTRTHQDKRALVHGLLEDKVLPATLRLVEQALAGSHRTVNLAIEDYQRIAASVEGEFVAEVTSAGALNGDERGRLHAALSKQYGRPVHLNVVIDPEVLGGLRIEIGDDVIDGSIANRLDHARRRLVG